MTGERITQFTREEISYIRRVRERHDEQNKHKEVGQRVRAFTVKDKVVTTFRSLTVARRFAHNTNTVIHYTQEGIDCGLR